MDGAAIVDEVTAVGPARPRRRGVSHRHQVEDGARRVGRPEVHRLQRRRGRLRHVLRPHDDGGRPVHADRGHDHRRHRGRRDDGLRLHPLRVSACGRHDARGGRGARPRPGWLGANILRVGQALRSRGPQGRGLVRLRRGDRDAREPRRQARRGAREAAAAGDRRACSASRRSSTTSSASRACRSSWTKGAAFYRDYGMGRSKGTLPFQLAGNIKQCGLVEKAFGADAARTDLRLRRRHRCPGGRSRRCRSAARSARTCPSRSGTCRSTTRRTRPSARPSATAAWSSTTTRPTSRNWPATRWSSARSSRAASARRAASGRSAASRRSTASVKPDAKHPRVQQVQLLRDLCDTMLYGSLCAMGGMTPYPVMSALNHYPDDFGIVAEVAPDVESGPRHRAAQDAHLLTESPNYRGTPC